MFIGKLRRSNRNRDNTFTHYFQVGEYIKYSEAYNEQSQFSLPDDSLRQCYDEVKSKNVTLLTYIGSTSQSTNSQNGWISPNSVLQQLPSDNHLEQTNPLSQEVDHNSSMTTTHQSTQPPGILPGNGIIKVYSKCEVMELDSEYLVSGTVSTVSVDGRSRERVWICCVDEDLDYAVGYLEDLLFRQECCNYYI